MIFALDPAALFASLIVPIQILFVNLLLSADNALVIALACRGLPARAAAKASLLGTAGAIALRLAMGSVAVFLLRVPCLQVVAGLLLLWIALRLTLVDDTGVGGTAVEGGRGAKPARQRVLVAVWAIIVADCTMSLDNVVALAAIAQGSVAKLAIGLGLSIPMLVWGSNRLRGLLDRTGLLVSAAGASLGGVAGHVALADPLIAPIVRSNAPALAYAVPTACAILVVCHTLILDPRRAPRVRHAD